MPSSIRLAALFALSLALAVPLQAQEGKRKAANLMFFSFGPSALFNTGSQGVAYGFQASGMWEAHPRASIRALGSLVVDPNDGAWMAAPGLGAALFLTDGEFSPYIGADLGFGLSGGRGSAFGFDLGSSIGLVLFRNSTAQMVLEGRVQTLLEKNDSDAFPSSIGLHVGIGI